MGKDFFSALEAPNQPGPALVSFEKLVQDTVGARLITIMTLDRSRGVARRAYSNHPETYPVSGEKPLVKNSWTDIVEGKHETFVANTIGEIRAVFEDADAIISLGCESCINVPIIIDGKLVGTLNCLHSAGYFTPERVQAAQTLKGPGAVLILMLNNMETSE